MKRQVKLVTAIVTAEICVIACSAAQSAITQDRYPRQNLSRVSEIAERLPHMPGTPAPRPCDRVAWTALAKSQGADNIISSAEGRCGKPIPELPDELYLEFSRTGNRSNFERPYFLRLQAFENFMLAEALEWKGRFVPEISRYLEAILAEKSWTLPAHDKKLDCFEGRKPLVKLFSTQRAWSVAYAIDWYGDLLPGDLVSRAKAECRRRILDPYLKACRDTAQIRATDSTWFFGPANWTPVCHAGCVATALILCEDKRERAECIEAAERAMPFYIAGFSDDGYCSEGMGYWNYGFGHYTTLVSIVSQATGGFVDFGSSGEKVARIAAYALSFQLEEGLSPYFADGGGTPEMSLVELAHRFWPDSIPESSAKCPILVGGTTNYGPIPPCRTVAMRAFGPKGRSGTVALPGELPQMTAFDIAQVYIFRPRHGKNGLALALKGGHNAEFHNHNDVGSYAISLGDQMLSGDVGGETYTARTFSSRRYEGEVINSFGHPVPRIGGGLQHRGREHAAKVLSKSFGDDKDIVVLDIKGAYECPALKRMERTFVYFRSKGTVTVRDDVEFSAPTAFDDPIMTLANAKRYGNGWTLSSKKANLAVDVSVSGGDWSWDVCTVDNGKPSTPQRLSVTFNKPLMKASVEFRFTP